MKFSSGGDSEEDTPVPIPNTEVKLFSVECSWVTPCETRTLPGNSESLPNGRFFFIYNKLTKKEKS